ncbi:hypothetical protein GPJ56_008161 [Histomonas meleagridis]|nr:hypothetical protein GPJ56_008161 [Histomonas meleagridis]
MIDQASREIAPISYYIPKCVCFTEKDEFKLFRLDLYQTFKMPMSFPQFTLIVNDTVLNVLIPPSSQNIQINVDYLTATPDNETAIACEELAPLCLKDAKVCFDPRNASQQPYTKLPFYYFSKNVLMIGAPKGFITTILLGQKNRIRCIFLTLVPDNSSYNQMYPLIDKYAISTVSGKFYNFKINYKFFIDQDPQYIIPYLHTQMNNEKFKLSEVLSESVLMSFWNSMVFNELLLICFNKHCLRKIYGQDFKEPNSKDGKEPKDPRVQIPFFENDICSTFSYRIMQISSNDKIKLFEGNTEKAKEPFHDFQDFGDFENDSSVFALSDMPPEISDYGSLSKLLLHLMENKGTYNTFQNNMFNYKSYPKKIRLPVMLQLAAMKYSFHLTARQTKEKDHQVKVDDEIIDMGLLETAETSPNVLQYWQGNGFETVAKKSQTNDSDKPQTLEEFQRDFLIARSEIAEGAVEPVNNGESNFICRLSELMSSYQDKLPGAYKFIENIHNEFIESIAAKSAYKFSFV